MSSGCKIPMSMPRAVPKICLVVSSMMTVQAFLLDHLAVLAKKYRVVVVANSKEERLVVAGGEIQIIPLPVIREISLLKDLKALYRLYRVFREQEFALICSVTPKAGLLSALAGFLARVPVRIHLFTGQVWLTRQGGSRWFFKKVDTMIAGLSTAILADSFSQRDFLVKQGVVAREKSSVLANGSICGVDGRRFRPDPKARASLRRRENIPDQAIVFLFVGRLNRDKGILDLAQAFALVAQEHRDTHLWLVGPDEEGLRTTVSRICEACSDRVHFIGYTKEPEKYMATADVLCLPSYREGFGSVIIEAAAAGLPAIGSRIYGIIDAIVEKQTGLLYEPGQVDELAGLMQLCVEQPKLLVEMGEKARIRARRDFDTNFLVQALLDFYEKKLADGQRH